ncbi:hypothetical protein TNCT_381311 [Trichonephila clavata]|uniref:Uncharacterized protein n=1 Tax=Trichonephila clavata TaxID=2740835 RepID=A0A8X6HFF1_TRICU|nr:hypothetical protein TNCT_381311 [Trichonephila clavata]
MLRHVVEIISIVSIGVKNTHAGIAIEELMYAQMLSLSLNHCSTLRSSSSIVFELVRFMGRSVVCEAGTIILVPMDLNILTVTSMEESMWMH